VQDKDSIPSILQTKLYRPRVTDDLVARPRLFEKLDCNRGNPLTLVAAPAGYGKSTLLASWLVEVDCPNAWISLDEQDNNLSEFLSYFLTAINRLFPGSLNESFAMLALQELPPINDLANILLNELISIEQNFILVLDDFHCISDVLIHDLIDQLLLHPPRGMQFILITRADPPLPLARMRSKGLLTEFRTHELRFTEDETQILLEKLLQTNLDEKDILLIDHQFEGWVTGLRLAALTMRDPSRVAQIIERIRGDSQFVREYLIAEVTGQLPLAIRTFLLKTSVLERLSGPLCDAVVGLDEPECDGQAYLEWLHDINLFIIPLDEQGNWFRYHNLMREHLQQELSRDFDAPTIAELHTRASIWLAQRGLLEEAIQHALKSGDKEMASHLVVQHRHGLIDQEEWNRLERWLKLFDQDAIESSPGLSIVEAWLYNVHGRWQEELATLSRVESLLASTSISQEIAQPIQGEIHLMRANLTGWTYNGSEVLKHTEIALELLPRQWRYAYTSAYMIDSFGHLLSGDINHARKQLQRGLADAQIISQPQNKTMLMFGLVGLFWTSLNFPEMRLFSRQYLSHGEEFKLQEAIAVANYFLGCTHYLQNDLPSARKYFSAAVETRFIISLNWQTQAACGLALTYCASGETEKAKELLETFRAKLIKRDNFMLLNVIKACQAELALYEGKVAEANYWAESYDPQPIIGLQMFYIPQLTLTRVWLAQGTSTSYEKAVSLLNQLMGIAKGAHLKSAQLSILLMQALLEQKRGHEAAAFKITEESIYLAEPNGIIRPFVDLGPKMAGLLQQLRKQGVAQDYIAQLIEAFPREHVVASHANQGSLIEPLTHRELEVLTLLSYRKRNQDIADELVVTLGTVKQYNHTIYQKLGVKDRHAAVAKATRLGILTPEP
jgi:LuxR family maltose regulon positive regulatory protein